MRKIIGPDVSFYQDDPGTPQGINFVRMNQVADFVIIRAGQNLWEDSDFKENWRRAKEAGLPRGSYWFYDSRADPRKQAELWVSVLGSDLGELPMFADFEETYNGPYKGWTHWRTFLERVRSLVGSKEIGIYTAYFYWRENAPTQPAELEYFHRYPLWIANYGTSQPMVPKPWVADEWLLWQYTASGDGLYFGVESLEIDLNYFNGDAQEFARRFNVPVPEDPLPPTDPVGNRYRVTAASLYVREGPGTTYPPVGSLVRNDIVEVLAANPDGSWYRIRRLSDGLTGWSASAYLEKISTPPPPPPPPPPTGDKYRVTVRSLYVRSGPGTNFPVVGSLVQNEIVESLGSNPDGTWLQIRRPSDGLTGWSSAAYLEKVTTPPPPPPPAEEKFRVTATRLHIRQGPGTQFPSLGYVELNEIVTGIGVNPDGTWRQIRRSDGLTGWSFARFLVPYTAPIPNPNEPPPDANAGDWYQVTGARLNVREGPGVSFPSKGYLVKDEGVQALSVSEDKAWIRFRRVDGFIAWAPVASMKKLGKTPASIMQKLFPGVTYYREEKSAPRRVISHALVIDARTEGLRFLVTPPVRDTAPQLCTRTTSRFLKEQGLQIAINGDGYKYYDPVQYPPQQYCSGGDPVSPLGYAASRGKIYSKGETGHPVLYINHRNEISFDQPTGKVYNAIAGDILLVARGKKVSGLDKTALHPRTAFGINQNGRWIYLFVVEGRETSEGVTFDELAGMLVSYAVHTGMALDGGGSSTMVVEGVDGLPRLVNSVIDEGIPGRERAVGNHLGIALKK